VEDSYKVPQTVVQISGKYIDLRKYLLANFLIIIPEIVDAALRPLKVNVLH
jgi:hypothetical protein